MNYKQNTGKTIEQSFIAYHEEHPEVFEQFKKYLRQIVREQKKRGIPSKKIKTSSKMIINRIRWEIATVGIQSGNSEENAENKVFDEFKINDAFTSRYARLFCEQNPDWKHLFNQRALRS